MRSIPELDTITLNSQFPLQSQMAIWERYALVEVLRALQPETSIEVGTYRGGSLQMLSHFSTNVFSIDIDPTIPSLLEGRFTNVEYRSGPSKTVIRSVLGECATRGLDVEFVLIDGDHTTAGVRADIEAFLELSPNTSCFILMHDSFNPPCREGIRTADWARSPRVHAVEIDFIPGIYHHEPYDDAGPRTMWGGFACALLKPTRREGELKLVASHQALFDLVYSGSAYSKPDFASRVAQRIRRARRFGETILTKQTIARP